MTGDRGFRRTKPRWGLIAALVLLHVLAIVGLARAFAPEFTASLVESATSLVTVNVSTYEEPPEPEVEPSPDPEPQVDEGAAGEEAEQAVAREVTAPEPAITLPSPSPAPRASSTGSANRSGAGEAQEDGTGAGGDGEGTGSGRSGSGQGGAAIVTGPSVRSGRIDAARDFPVPEGGRQVRYGTSVTVRFTVGVNGRARDCRVVDPGPHPPTNARVCPLVIERIRFNPARNAAGQAVPAPYGWRQEFFGPGGG